MAIYILSYDEKIVKECKRSEIPADYYGPVISVSDSNTKLAKTAGGVNENGEYIPSTRWIIFNLPAVVTCPFRTRLCGGYIKEEKKYDEAGSRLDYAACYAVRPESFRPEVLPARRDNLRASIMPQFVDMMTAIIKKIAGSMKKERVIVRIHESGDFYNRVYAEKWQQIARNCADDSRIVFWAYTKSFPFFDGVKLPDNFRMRASIWSDTDPDQLEIIRRNNWPFYTVYEKTLPAGYTECRCKDCADCNQCGDMTIKAIACKRH